MRAVFRWHMDVPSKNARRGCGPGARSAEGALRKGTRKIKSNSQSQSNYNCKGKSKGKGEGASKNRGRLRAIAATIGTPWHQIAGRENA
ncbi:hypothetical protein NRY95_00605 [Xanthomonas campestris pv. phormiicola]|nr:hypothetical protein [Xanthomonas campestris pv. phormiicola]UYC16524.1 hypothetical protein NRY95_00605 [Xanthomonas campestris pv. phormiicola]